MYKANSKPKMSRNKKILLIIIFTILFIFIIIKICSFIEDKILLDDLKNQINNSDSSITICDLKVTPYSYKENAIDIGVIVSYDYEKDISSNERAASALKIRNIVQAYLDTHSISKYNLFENIRLYIECTCDPIMFNSTTFVSFTSQYYDNLEDIFDEEVVSGKKLDSMQCRSNVYSTDDLKYFSDCKSICVRAPDLAIDDFSFLEDFTNLKCLHISNIIDKEDIEACKKHLPSGCKIYVPYTDKKGDTQYMKIQT